MDKRKTQFCPRGHNKNLVGRFKGGACKACKKIWIAEYRAKNPNQTIEIYTKSNNKRSKNGKLRDWHLVNAYGITLAYYNELIVKQNNACAICLISMDFMKRTLHVDHDHKTGKVRGLLCYHCNSVLGYAKDNIEILMKAIEYLKMEKK